MSEHDRPVIGVVVPAGHTTTGSDQRVRIPREHELAAMHDETIRRHEAFLAREAAQSPPRREPRSPRESVGPVLDLRCAFCGDTYEDDAGPTYTLAITRATSSLNDRRVNAGASRLDYAKERRIWELELEVERRRLEIPKATGPRRVVILRYVAAPPPNQRRLGRKAAQLMDHANFVGGCKPLVDAMVKTGLLLDDDPKHLRDHYKQVVSDFATDFDKVEIQITDLVVPS